MSASFAVPLSEHDPKMSHEGYRKTRRVLQGRGSSARKSSTAISRPVNAVRARSARHQDGEHGRRDRSGVRPLAERCMVAEREKAASTRSKWRWLEAEVARAGGTRSWTAQEDGDAARRGLRRRRQHLGQPLRLQALSSSMAGCGCRKSSLVEPSARAATRTGSVVAE